jgi:uncharacterized damage-inducible protein DinB
MMSMMIKHFQQLYAYNDWAWDQVFLSLERLDPAEYHLDRSFFWGSLHGLTVHALTAEWLWLRRIGGDSPTALLDPVDFPDFAMVRATWLPVRSEWKRLLESLAVADLPRPVSYRTTQGTPHTLPLLDILQHVPNHATEHRSQMTPVLYALGVPTPPLDYMRFRLESQSS